MTVDYGVFVVLTSIQRFRGLPFIDDITHMQKRYRNALEDILERSKKKHDQIQGKAIDEDWRVGWVIESNTDCVPWFCVGLLNNMTLFLLPTKYMTALGPAMLTCAFKDEPEMERHYGDVIPF